jgi:DNA-binding transcriptional ArsR family regulator
LHSKERILELHNRNKIYEFILKYPGVHQRQIIQKIDLSEGTIKHHLNVLLKEDLIVEKEINGYKRFYGQGKNGLFEKNILAGFREKTPRFILFFILCSVVSSVSEISREMDKDRKTISYHINKLMEMDLVEIVPLENGLLLTKERKRRIIKDIKNKEILYRLKHYTLTYQYFLKYKKRFLDDNNIKDMLDYLTYFGEGQINAKCVDVKGPYDNLMEVFFDIFPFPWCA